MLTEEQKIDAKALREEGYSYRKISQKLKSTIDKVIYYLSPTKKEVSRRSRKKYRTGPNYKYKKCNRKPVHPYIKKVGAFLSRETESKKLKSTKLYKLVDGISKLKYIKFFRKYKLSIIQEIAKQVKEKFGENPTCYLTGDKIDISLSNTYHFDHITPKSRGGENTIENLGICTSEANFSKRDMTPEEYIALCKKVLEHNGYEVKPKV